MPLKTYTPPPPPHPPLPCVPSPPLTPYQSLAGENLQLPAPVYPLRDDTPSHGVQAHRQYVRPQPGLHGRRTDHRGSHHSRSSGLLRSHTGAGHHQLQRHPHACTRHPGGPSHHRQQQWEPQADAGSFAMRVQASIRHLCGAKRNQEGEWLRIGQKAQHELSSAQLLQRM